MNNNSSTPGGKEPSLEHNNKSPSSSNKNIIDSPDLEKNSLSPGQVGIKIISENNTPEDKEKTLNMEQMNALQGMKSSITTSQNKSQNNPNTTTEINKRYLDDTQDEDVNMTRNRLYNRNSNIKDHENAGRQQYRNGVEQNDDYNEDHSRNNILPQDDYDDDDDYDDSIDGDNQSMYSHVASQHPMSVDEERVNTTQKTEGSDGENEVRKLQMTKKELAPILLYQFGFLICVIIPPLILYQDCRTSPFFISHIIFLILQIVLFGISTFYHRRKNGKNDQNANNSIYDGSGSLMRSQGRCCREILSQMKLIDTYTNLCFFSLVINQSDKITGFIYGISAASIALTLLLKVILILYFVIFVLFKLGKVPKEKQENEDSTLMKKNVSQTILNQKTLTRLLLWLDQDTIAKLYDPDSNSGESQLFTFHKHRYSYIKSIIEDAPLAAMQALYLSQETCSAGLNSIIIISLYFNSVCILYSLSNLCSSKNKDGGGSKVYKKEMDRLKDYYDGNQARIIAEFYIEDQSDVQSIKMKALNEFLSYHEYDVQSFNFSTNQMSEETINYLQEIIVNSSESLEDLTLSRCKLKSNHLSYFYYPKCLVRLNLSENRIGDTGAKHIANYLLEKNQDSLLALNLEHNNISEQGALQLLKAIQQSSIVHINLRKNRGDPVTQQFSLNLAFDFFKALQLNFIRYFARKKLQANGSRLEEPYMVKLSLNESIDRVLLQLFKIDTAQTLRSLDLSMRFYRSMRSNQQREKAQNNIQNQNKNLLVKGLKFYDDEQKLILLAIHYNSNLIKNLPDNEKQLLNQVQNWFCLGNSLNSINLSSNWLSQKAQQMIFTSLSQMSNLKELVFNNNYIKNTPLFFKSISECRNLESVFLKSCSFYGIYEVEFKTCFQNLENLKDLHLSYSNISDQTIQMLAECIPQMKNIQKINLKQCGLSHVSLDSIFEKLSTNATILSMNLSQNDLQGILQLGKFIKMNKTIEKLKLSKSQLSDNELKQVSYGLKINKSLRILDLSQNQIQNVGQIKDGMSCNIALEKLDISNNVIDNDGLIKLSEAFISNACLETISISFNDYQMAGILEFFKIFEQNDTLQNVSFSIPQILTDAELNDLSNVIVKTLVGMKGSFKRLEILGNVKKLKESEFFYKFIKEGAFNIEELIIDSILKRNQLLEIVNALKIILEGPQNKNELDKFNNHKLKRITFVKPQEFSEEIQILENLLEEKQNLFFLPQQLKQRFNRIQQQQIEQQEMEFSQQQQQQQQQIVQQQNNGVNYNPSSKKADNINGGQPLQSQLQKPQQSEADDSDYDNGTNQLDSQLDSNRTERDEIEAGIQQNVPMGNTNMGKQVFQQKSKFNTSFNDNKI